jgi:hypothetical protein
MNWYEFADADEVKETLEALLHSYGFAETEWTHNVPEHDLRSVVVFPEQAFEIAEALWGEYSEKLFS